MKIKLLLIPLCLILKTLCMQETINYFNSLIPLDIDLRQRVLTTVCCQDCAYIPKVNDSGKVLNTQPPIQIMHNGLKVLKDCYYGSWMTKLIELLHGHHEPQEEKAFYEVLKYIPANASMIELGSYWGFYSMWFQKEIIDARNYLIEPDPSNILIGQKNFALNNLQGDFTQAMIGSHSNDNAIFVDWHYNKHEIKQLSVDDFATVKKIDFIYMLHSDIQGAEVKMLKGCQRLLTERKIGYLFISTHRGAHEKCLDLLHKHNMEIILSITREESFHADGLIVAKLPEIAGPKSIEVSRRTPDFCKLIEEA